jgi:hypothetical protein
MDEKSIALVARLKVIAAKRPDDELVVIALALAEMLIIAWRMASRCERTIHDFEKILEGK